MTTTAELNELLARSLGRNPFGEGLFMWARSEDLFWPEYPTGQTVSKPVEIPIIGGGVEIAQSVVPEYRKESMCPQLDRQWVITLWYAPEELAHWQSRFPGAAYPSRGYRINTNASLPSYPGGPSQPTMQETERFIHLLKEQRSQGTVIDVAAGIIAEQDAKRLAMRKEIEDEVADGFNAFMNPNPGARGGFVSFPGSEKENAGLVLP